MLYREVPAVINKIRDLMVGVFEHLDIMSKLDLYLVIKCTERILREEYLKIYTEPVSLQGGV